MTRPVRRKLTRPTIVLAAVLLLVAVRIYQTYYAPDALSSVQPDSLAEETYRVKRVVDGDTLLLENGARVRLEGIDTPETVKPDYPVEPWGPEASRFTKNAISENGGVVRLQLGRQRKDRHGRFLAFVWTGETLLNEELVRAGLATAETHYHYSATLKRRLAAAEEEAREAHRGIWSR